MDESGVSWENTKQIIIIDGSPILRAAEILRKFIPVNETQRLTHVHLACNMVQKELYLHPCDL